MYFYTSATLSARIPHEYTYFNILGQVSTAMSLLLYFQLVFYRSFFTFSYVDEE
jgi:hypothetical protein